MIFGKAGLPLWKKMNTESEILKLRDQIVSAASAYYYAVEDVLKESSYSISYIYEQRDRIHHALLWMMHDDLIVVDNFALIILRWTKNQLM